MGMLMTYRPGYYPGDALEDDGKRAAVKAAGARGDSSGDEFTDLSDEPVAEQYAERVGGNATTRRGQLKALRKLEPVEKDDKPARWDDLTDEQVAEAYATNLPDGEATDRDAQVVELRAVDAFAHQFDADPDKGDGGE